MVTSRPAPGAPAGNGDEHETTGDVLRRYGRVLARHKALIATCVAVSATAAIALTVVQEPTYRATTTLLVRASQSPQLDDGSESGRSDPQRLVDTEIEVLQSGSVTSEAEKRLGYQPAIAISTTGQTDTIDVTATAGSADEAAADANAYAQTYLDVTAFRTVNDLTQAANDAQTKIDDIDRGIAELQTAVAALDAQILAASSDERIALETNKRELEATTEVEEATLRDQRAYYVQERDRLEVATSLSGRAGPEVIGEATPPGSAASPDPQRNLAIGLGLGLLLGVGAAFLRETLDETVKTKADLERAAPSMTVVGLVPAAEVGKRRDRRRNGGSAQQPPTEVFSLTQPHSPVSEAFRTVRSSIQFLGVDRRIGVLQVTSAQAGEGKTTTAANLAVAFARAGLRVVAVCCDWRRPQLHACFGLDNRVGFTSVLVGDVPLAGAITNLPRPSTLAILPAGPPPPNPSELLGSSRSREIISTLQKSADLVIIDTPPIVPVSDALVVAPQADALLLVTRSGATTRHGLRRAIDLLDQVEAPLIGTVLLGVTSADAYGTDVTYGSLYANGSASNGNGSSESGHVTPGSSARRA